MTSTIPSGQPENKLQSLFEKYFCDVIDQHKHESKLKKYAEQYLSRYNFVEKAKIHKALSDEKRLKTLKLLTFREMCVCELTAALGLTQPNLTHHIKKLEHAGLVNHEKRGKWVYYSIINEQDLKELRAI